MVLAWQVKREGGRRPENLYLAVNSFTCTFRYHQSRGTNYLLVGFIGLDLVTDNTWAQAKCTLYMRLYSTKVVKVRVTCFSIIDRYCILPKPVLSLLVSLLSCSWQSLVYCRQLCCCWRPCYCWRPSSCWRPCYCWLSFLVSLGTFCY